ncbi:hypothetical protein KY092_10385 [Natronomonas gomsonensis]|uniref:hypothetical protein n=1 Tax=Natronomonas gomsonensis TaxID=1046043 RepID=UPI0020CA7163|nr:hypothetical protein [Natronomonas gomsonensis]MCY4730960.1 hypothetical protein [Natronomonas gomsonensis]
MVLDAIRNVALARLGRLLFSALLVGAALLVAISLVFGTEALMALGLPRDVAGPIITLVVVAACIYGLYWFATRMIDW